MKLKKRCALYGDFVFEMGDVEGEDLYAAMGRTAAGRYLIIYFVHKRTERAKTTRSRGLYPLAGFEVTIEGTGEALIISARNVTKKEKRFYAKK